MPVQLGAVKHSRPTALADSSADSSMDLHELTDEKLYFLCQHYGDQALRWRRKFIGLLPEAHRRRLPEKKGFSSIFEFAKKLAGLSEEQVRRVLNLYKRFEDKPFLKSMLENGEVSVNKLALVASIASPENQDFLATQVRLLPKSALETLIRDEKLNATVLHESSRNRYLHSVNLIEDQNGFFKPDFDKKSVPGNTTLQQDQIDATAGQLSLNLSEEVVKKLLELQGLGIDINKLLLEFLEKRETEIVQEKEKLSKEAQKNPTTSRYIPAETRKLLKKEYGTKCSIFWCKKPAEEIHHTQRLSLGKTHDPKYLAPLCAEHHKIAHSIDIKFHEQAHANRGGGIAGISAKTVDGERRTGREREKDALVGGIHAEP